MQKLEFSYNWNGKLGSKYFTTIRIWNPDKYVLNGFYECHFLERHLYEAQLIAADRRKKHEFSEKEAVLDTGYPLAKLPEILERMYPNYKGDFGLYLFRNVDYKNEAPANRTNEVVTLKQAYKRLTAENLKERLAEFPEDNDTFLFQTITDACFAYSSSIIADKDNAPKIEATNRKILALISYQIGLVSTEILRKSILHINYCRTQILADFTRFSELPLLLI
jgi:hypothetical protein